ncbi:SRPBCC family protein [Paracoccus sp. MC1862]|uniref:SRPBCC family protein n=1 Tax=Paracoccus sp. MC1862 TaxID=2760307 RepID=UPI0016025BCE|nr:SRPBCC family protein [Paracoccus sp. MC1862]MBB1496855.1 SRPBCC family protein [Paracoccus sp. MC1862]QQO45482.1 SRPBCC family protein [Paracoccus sp. MC1862]
MKFSLRQDTGLPAVQLFDAISDFPRMERMLVRRGTSIRRVDPAQEPGAGMAWDLAFDHRGKRRELRLDVTRFDRPEKIAMAGGSDSLDIGIEMTVVALTRAKSRVIFELKVKPRNMRARLMLQTAKLGKAQLDRRFADKVGKFLFDLTERRR